MIFSNPVPNSFINKSNSGKSVKLFSYPGDKIKAPADGQVVEAFNEGDYLGSSCPKGYIKIRHMIMGKIIFTTFCGVDNISVSRGTEVMRGQVIGGMGNKEVKYTIMDENKSKFTIKSDGDIDIEEKTKKSKKDSDSEKTYKTDITTRDYGNFNAEKNVDPLTRLALFPFDIVSLVRKAYKKRKQKAKEKKEEEKRRKKEEEEKRKTEYASQTQDQSTATSAPQITTTTTTMGLTTTTTTSSGVMPENYRLTEEIERIKKLM
jgi:hypothetical protein